MSDFSTTLVYGMDSSMVKTLCVELFWNGVGFDPPLNVPEGAQDMATDVLLPAFVWFSCCFSSI